MQIQRIDICGFKSFNQRAVISFDDGVTGIVGPNGCGKSNVVDAIRWVMGEQSAKHLRGRSMEDVIFAGSETQGGSGMAEVALTLRNDRPSELPTQYQGFSEITIARRLYRDGRSEYLINKAACRLLDITELFLGTGVGTRAYSIIEQGKVGMIVNSKPEERRALLEEAAGITKYKARKKVAERKLEYTEQNLLRVADIAGEMKRQLGSLERQARKAERYRELKDEIREIELHEAAARWLELRASLNHLHVARVGQSEAAEHLSSRLQQLELEHTNARERLAEVETELESLRAKSHAIELSVQRETQQRTFGAQQRYELEQQNVQLGKQVVEAEGRRAALLLERTGLIELVAVIEEQVERDQGSLSGLESELADRSAQEKVVRQQLDSERSSLADLDGTASALRVSISAAERRQSELSKRTDRLQAEIGEVEGKRAELASQLATSSGQSAETQQLQLSLSSRKEEVQQALLASRAAFEQNEATRRTVRDELADRRSRLKTLEDLQRNLEGHGRGTRTVMLGAEGQHALEGVRGLLTDAFHAPQEIENALEAYLEHQLEDIIVQDDQVALRGAAILTRTNGGRAKFLPLNTQMPAGTPAAVEFPDCLGRAGDLVQSIPGAEAIVAGVLGDVWVFRTLDSAVAARTAGFQPDMVSLAGEVLWSGGALSAGGLEGPGHGAISRRREADELTQLVVELQGKLELAQRQHADLSHRIASEEALLKAVTQDSQTQEIALANHRQDVRRITEQLAAFEERSQSLRGEQATVVSGLDEVAQELAMARTSLASAEAAGLERRANLGAQVEAVAELARAVTVAGDRLTELKIKLAGDSQRAAATREQTDRNQRQSDELREREEASSSRMIENQTRIEELAEEVLGCEARLLDLGREGEEVVRSLTVAAEGRTARIERVEETEGHLRVTREELEEVRSVLGKLQIQEREAILSMEHLLAAIRDRHSLELTLELHRFHCLAAPTDANKRRLAELREAVERMGEINLTAIREHEDVRQRYEYLSQQKLDLENSIAQLREAIIKINRTSRDRLRETFEMVNARFADVFPRLFQGGKAGLALIEEGGDVLDAGVEIFAQPPGKRLQSVNLLSGGEKALTAVALIFAIFLIKPTPFCILDEVDAPLDEGNVGRYSDLVREISKISQFILITHNKRTMQIADTLYGVTMEEPGCSKLVSVNLNQRDVAANAA